MPIRITGMNSGLDTDRIIQEMVRGQKSKVDNIKKNQTSLQWKQDAWKELNTKALKLFNGTLSKLRYSDAYMKKTSKVSNNKATVVTGDIAVNGVQNLQINRLAKTAMLTGAKLDKDLNGNALSVTGDTKLSQLMDTTSGDPMSFTIKSGGTERVVTLTGDTKISDVVNQFRNAGLNANFDASNGRFFISSKTMGDAGDFSITANNENGFTALNKLGINVFNAADYTGLAGIKDGLGNILPARQAEYDALVADYAAILKQADVNKLATDQTSHNTINNLINEKLTAYKQYLIDIGRDLSDKDGTGIAYTDREIFEEIGTLTNDFKKDFDDKFSVLEGLADDDPNKADLEADFNSFMSINASLAALNYGMYDVDKYDADVTARGALATSISALEAKTDGSGASEAAYEASAKAKVDADIAFAKHALTLTGNQIGANGASRIDGEDAEISLNGATFKSNTNVFTINGLTITASQVTDPGEIDDSDPLNPKVIRPPEIITITTEDDTDGIYNMIKDFLKEYNILINEMDRLYNAPSARDYKPLTEEEKDTMSEREIDDWEKKIKDSLLRRDSSLSSISSAMKTAMLSPVEINGKNMYLNNFGIETLDFFLAAINEKNAFFINGDPDSAHTSGKADKLREMIANDPKTVTDFFIGLSRNLYAEMNNIIMKSDTLKGTNQIYNDKQLKKDYENYTKAIAAQEAKLLKLEDKYYKQFSAMEVAMAKMQSSQSAISGLLGMGGQR